MRRGQRADINGANAGKRESGLRNRRGNNHVTTTIFAKAVSFTDDDYSTLLGFADDPNAPSNYVMLNMTNEPDEQDLGLDQGRSEEHTSELQSLMRISYAVFCLKKNNTLV